jgi:cell division transport system permease protein
LAAWGIVAAAVLVLNIELADLGGLYGTMIALDWPVATEVLILLGFSVVLGWLGAWLSVSRHLWQIEPR